MNEKQYWIWFASLNLLPIKKNRLLKALKNVENIFFAKENELLKINGIDLIDVSEIINNKNLNLIMEYEKYINKMDIKVINISEDIYPKYLKQIYDPPVVLFCKGNTELFYKKGIAVVGSREADKYGLLESYKIAYNLAQNKFTIISGLAKGIDKMAHLGALKASGETIAVLGTGLDIVYPRENYNVYNDIQNKGLLISEFIVGTRPSPKNFPMRNRIISALSEGVLVVQAKEKSGAMITVDFALDEGKNVYAIPRKHKYAFKFRL